MPLGEPVPTAWGLKKCLHFLPLGNFVFPLFDRKSGEHQDKRILQRAVTLGVFVPLSSPSALVWTLVFITAFCFCLCGKSVFTDDNPHYGSLSSMHVWVDTLTRFQGCKPGLPKL